MLGLIAKHKCSPMRVSIHSKEKAWYNDRELDNTYEHIFDISFIDRLDKAFIKDNYNYLSLNQEIALKQFFNDAIGTLSDFSKQLDNYLGSYTGENNGRYIRK